MKTKYDSPWSNLSARIDAGVVLVTLLVTATWAQSNRVVIYSKPEQPAASFAVYISEKLDTMQEQYSTSDSRQQIVQGILENALVHSNYKLVNFALSESGAPVSVLDALNKARKMGIDYLIIGQATAFQINTGSTTPTIEIHTGKINASAALSAQVITVRDGSVLIAEVANSAGSAESDKAAGQGALREAADQLASKLLSSLSLKLKEN